MAYSKLEGKNVVIIGGTAGIVSLPQRLLPIRAPRSGRPEGRSRTLKQPQGVKAALKSDRLTPKRAEALDAIFREVGKIDHLVRCCGW